MFFTSGLNYKFKFGDKSNVEMLISIFVVIYEHKTIIFGLSKELSSTTVDSNSLFLNLKV